MSISQPFNTNSRYDARSAALELSLISKPRNEISLSPQHSVVSLYSVMAKLSADRRRADSPVYSLDTATATADKPLGIPYTGKIVPVLEQ